MQFFTIKNLSTTDQSITIDGETYNLVRGDSISLNVEEEIITIGGQLITPSSVESTAYIGDNSIFVDPTFDPVEIYGMGFLVGLSFWSFAFFVRILSRTTQTNCEL